VAKRQTQAA